MAGGIKTLICKYPSLRAKPWCLTSASRPSLTWVPLLARVRRGLRVFGTWWVILDIVTLPGSAESWAWVLLHHISRTGGVCTRTTGLCWGEALDSSLRQMSRKSWMCKPRKGTPCLHGPIGQTARVGRASAAARARSPSRSAVECVFIYILPGEAAWGMMVGTAAALPGWGWVSTPFSLGTAGAGGLWAGGTDDLNLFLQRSFCSMEKHIL